MIDSLLKAITESDGLIESFTRYDYREAFQEYLTSYELLYETALHETEDLPALADSLLDALEESRKKLHFWNRGSVHAEQKMAMVGYFSPMLLHAKEPKCHEFASIVCEKWKTRWPKDSYEVSDFENLQNGFRHVIMGIDLANKHIDK